MVTAFANIVGADGVVEGDAARPFAVDGITPQCVVFPTTVDELSRCLATLDSAGLTAIPVGNGTHLGIGRVPARYDVAVSTQRLCRIVAHEAADMTVTVEAGVTLSTLNAVLGAAAQRLPLDPPQPERTTIGALIATDASGPLRLSQGTVRDLLIGITTVLADGRPVHGGGRVVKNVAGYDLMKLFTGSFGTLGLIAEVTFKVRPCPSREAAFVAPAVSIEAAARFALAVLNANVTPLYIELLNRRAAQLVGIDVSDVAVVVGCGESPEEIDVQHARLTALAADGALRVYRDAEATLLYAHLRDLPATGTPSYGCAMSLLPSKLGTVLQRIDDQAAQWGIDAVLIAHVGNGAASIRCSAVAGASDSLTPFAEWMRATVAASGGYTVFDLLPTVAKEGIDPWGTDVPGLALMRGIKQTLDPHNRLSPGRFVGGI